MINSGLPLVQSLDILAEQTENVALRKTISEVLYDVESGHTLADAMGRHPKVFTELCVNRVAAGEAGGILDTILLRLATFLEKNDGQLCPWATSAMENLRKGRMGPTLGSTHYGCRPFR